MAYDSNLELEFHGSIFGQVVFTQLEFHRESAVPVFSAEDICSYAYSVYWDAMQPILSDKYTLNEIRARVYQVPSSANIPEFVLAVGEDGAVAGDCLPPFVTVVMVKVPDNTTIFPVASQEFRNGRTSFSGIPEGQQDNGLLNSAAIGSWNNVFELLEDITITVGGTPYTWTLGLERGEVTPVKVLIGETYCRQKLGTQNTRKR